MSRFAGYAMLSPESLRVDRVLAGAQPNPPASNRLARSAVGRIRPRAMVDIGGGGSRLPQPQRGIALVVALLLLIVIALVGFAAVRGTIMQQKMAANQYDRQVAFQSAEAAMVVAQHRILTDPGSVARDCLPGGTTCSANPFNDSSVTSAIVNVLPGSGSTASNSTFTKSVVSSSQPQYVIENMGNWLDPTSDTGFNQTANAAQYGAQGTSSTATYYRITARSGDPGKVGDRAVVTLQAFVKQD